MKQVLDWSIINYVPLTHFEKKDSHVLFYEDVVTDLNQEIAAVKD